MEGRTFYEGIVPYQGFEILRLLRDACCRSLKPVEPGTMPVWGLLLLSASSGMSRWVEVPCWLLLREEEQLNDRVWHNFPCSLL